MTTTKSLRSIITLSLALATLLGYSFISAWTAPTGTAPANNVPAPINVGISTASVQSGFGTLAFDNLAAFNGVYSNSYCDLSGANCITLSGGRVYSSYSDSGTFNTWVDQTANCSLVGVRNGGCDSGFSCELSITNGTWHANQSNRGDCDYTPSCTYMCYDVATVPAYTHAWSSSAWSYCSASDSCSTDGYQSRSVSCLRSDGSTAADSECAGARPVEGQSCVATRRGSDC